MHTTDFEYAGEKLSDYGMLLCTFGTPGEIETVSSGADLLFLQVNPSGRSYFNIASTSYEAAYTTTFQICKDPCTNGDMTLSSSEVSSLQRWLCRKNQYYRFKIHQEDFEHIYWNATFSAKQMNLNGNIIGMELTLLTDAPFAYMDEIQIHEDCSGEKLSFDLFDMSDEEGYIYPNIEIELLETGDGVFQLSNSLDGIKFTRIKNCTAGEKISIHGKTHLISTTGNHVLSKDFNYVFPKIINTYLDNKNVFTCSLKCKITISYSPIRKVGL